MAKKDLEAINTKKTATGTDNGAAYDAIERGKSSYKQQGTASPEEQEARKAAMKTQGRKGCKAARLNVVISPDNHEYLRVMSKITGKSITQYLNFVIEKDRKDNADLYAQAQQFIDAIGINEE